MRCAIGGSQNTGLRPFHALGLLRVRTYSSLEKLLFSNLHRLALRCVFVCTTSCCLEMSMHMSIMRPVSFFAGASLYTSANPSLKSTKTLVADGFISIPLLNPNLNSGATSKICLTTSWTSMNARSLCSSFVSSWPRYVVCDPVMRTFGQDTWCVFPVT